MARGIKDNETDQPSAAALESYRQLVELQKQIIELAQHNEYSKRACDQLRDRMAADLFSQPSAREVAQSQPEETELLTRSSMTLAKSGLLSLITKEPTAC
jgi:hypothetical protein